MSQFMTSANTTTSSSNIRTTRQPMIKTTAALCLVLVSTSLAVAANDDCCLCDNDCNFEDLQRTEVGIDMGDSTVITDCGVLAADLFFHADPDECAEKSFIYEGVCCPMSELAPEEEADLDDDDYVDDDAIVAQHYDLEEPHESVRRVLQFATSWSATSYRAWTPTQSSSSSFGFAPSWPSPPSFPRPTPISIPRPSPPAPRSWWSPTPSFPRPSPPTFSPPTFSTVWFPAPGPAPRPAPRPAPTTNWFPVPRPAPAPPANWGNNLPSPTSSSSSSSTAWVNAHNTRRQQYHQQNRVSYVPVKWSNDLATSARSYAQKLSSGLIGCQIRHGYNNDKYGGENLAMQITGSSTSTSAEAVLRLWYEGELNMSYPQNGHLTQVVWRGTKYVGCGVVSKPMGNGQYCHIQACRYLAPGNCNGVGNILNDSSSCGPQCPREGCF